jgi:tetratricopeptide (TPR) repeat protein
MSHRRLFGFLVLSAALIAGARLWADPLNGKASPGVRGASDAELVERLLSARRDYQAILESIRKHYIQTGDVERARWAEEELVSYHRIPKYAFRLDMDVPPPGLHKQGSINIPEANDLYRRGLLYKDKGWGSTFTDNQRRAELLFQQLLTNYPLSDKISDAAYQLGDIYESSAYHQYDRAAAYFERCFQWNSKTQLDARMRAARLYERNLNERGRALEIYKEIQSTEIDPRRVEEAQRRVTALSGKK